LGARLNRLEVLGRLVVLSLVVIFEFGFLKNAPFQLLVLSLTFFELGRHQQNLLFEVKLLLLVEFLSLQELG
jgi:hypothetical protein